MSVAKNLRCFENTFASLISCTYQEMFSLPCLPLGRKKKVLVASYQMCENELSGKCTVKVVVTHKNDAHWESSETKPAQEQIMYKVC